VIPSIVGRLVADEDRAKARRVMQAMMKRVKIDVRALLEAAKGPEGAPRKPYFW